MATMKSWGAGLATLISNPKSAPASLIILSVIFVGTTQIWLAETPLQNTDLHIKTTTPIKNDHIPYQTSFIPDSFADFTHAASATALDNGDILATWYSGTREGAKDIDIYIARFDSHERRWLNKKILMTRAQSAQGLQRHIRKLGNTVISKAPNGRLWLFYVSVSYGGWATSAINVMYSDNDGQSWSTPTRLISSPFFNISTLVKTNPLYLEDGTLLLPVYHEFIGKFAEILYINEQAKVIEKRRITSGDHSLQPSLIANNGKQILALMRHAKKNDYILASVSADRGLNWSAESRTKIFNPNTAITALRLSNGSILLAANDLPFGRNQLSLFLSHDQGRNWGKIREIEKVTAKYEGRYIPYEEFQQLTSADLLNAKDAIIPNNIEAVLKNNMCTQFQLCKSHYSYPYLVASNNGVIHLFYAWQQSALKHVYFSESNLLMLNQQLGSPKP